MSELESRLIIDLENRCVGGVCKKKDLQKQIEALRYLWDIDDV